MELSGLLAFALVAGLLTVTPGPNSLVVFFGRRVTALQALDPGHHGNRVRRGRGALGHVATVTILRSVFAMASANQSALR